MKTDRIASPENMSAHLSFGAHKMHGPSMADWSILADCSLFNPTFVGFEETSCYWSVQFFSAFRQQTSYDSGILSPSQRYGIIRDFIGHHQSANLV